jgi:hypothetical protein
MKLDKLRQHDILFYHTENSFVPEAIQAITGSKWNHVGSISRIASLNPDEIFIAESIASGYKERTLRESIEENDKEVLVCRYHADGVGGKELSPEQIKNLQDWDERILAKNISYGFAQIAALALLKQIENDSIAGKFLGKKLEEYQVQIEYFVPQMICSESVFRKFNESGCPVEILGDSRHLDHYTHGGGVLERYIHNHGDTLDVVIEDWISPHDLFESPDIITMDTLEITWR